MKMLLFAVALAAFVVPRSATASECRNITGAEAIDFAFAIVDGVIEQPMEGSQLTVIRTTKIWKGPPQKRYIIAEEGGGLWAMSKGDRVRVFLSDRAWNRSEPAPPLANGQRIFYANVCNNGLDDDDHVQIIQIFSRQDAKNAAWPVSHPQYTVGRLKKLLGPANGAKPQMDLRPDFPIAPAD